MRHSHLTGHFFATGFTATISLDVMQGIQQRAHSSPRATKGYESIFDPATCFLIQKKACALILSPL
jgi:hypothetical protein